MTEQFIRTAALLGSEAMERLAAAHVAVFGIGGVGGTCAEALARSGVGALTLFDSDTVEESNINRQTVAYYSTVGRLKTDVMRSRIADINPHAEVFTHNVFYLPENADEFPLEGYDYIIDAVDTVSAKLEIAVRAAAAGVRMISSMGTGNKLCPELLEVADIYKTSVCPLARVMRRELKARGIRALKVVYSKELPREGLGRTPASCSFVPPAAGLIMAAEAVKDIAFPDPAQAGVAANK